MQTIPLFKGLTRPPMIFGVPIVPLFVAMGAIFLISFYTQNIFMTILSVPVYFVMKQMAKKDDFIFHLLFLKMKFLQIHFQRNFIMSKLTQQIITIINKIQKISFQNFHFFILMLNQILKS